MESIVKKLFLLGSATLAIAVSLTAMSSTHAYTCSDSDKANGLCTDNLANSTQKTFGMSSTFSFSVARVFELTNVSGDAVTISDISKLNEQGKISAQVKSNVPFTVQLSTAEGSNGNLINESDDSQAITAGVLSAADAGKNNLWAVKDVNNAYAAITSSPIVYSSGTGSSFVPVTGEENNNKGIQVPFGVSVTPTLPAGTYSTSVKVTVISQN